MVVFFWTRGLRTLQNAAQRSCKRVHYCTAVQAGKKSVNGVELCYQQTGAGDHALLLMPGALGSGVTDFGPQLKGLDKKRFTVVAFDPRGYGSSRPPIRDFPSDFFHRDAQDGLQLMQVLGFSRFSLLGWSDGGITALIAAALSPANVRKLVVWGSNAYVSQEDIAIYNSVRDVSRWSERMRSPMEVMYGAEYFRNTWSAWVDGISQFTHNPQGSICLELLPQISCPTLVVHGQKDPMVPSVHPQVLLQHIPNARCTDAQLHRFYGGLCHTPHPLLNTEGIQES
ncbi:valacyclovir hydrolase isoform X2 [Clupea harengus]|uniref:Valacyclovir hydrolase isoform X2 n=1 Tax=Clupea harengus TaxID=7950 RepID=A0A6P8FSZ6_CLUHA|nr:valacyclovir hydrolase isoform X2 [Clupea harengus]